MAISKINNNPIVGNLQPATLTTSYSTIDGLIDNVPNDNYFLMLDNSGEFVCGSYPTGNRQQIFGWINDTRRYAQIIVLTFRGVYLVTRYNSTTSVVSKLGGVNARLLRDLLSGGLHDKQDKAGHIRQCWNICSKHWKEYNPVSVQKQCKLSYAVWGRSFFNMHNRCDNSQCRDIIEWQTRPYSNSKWRLQLYTRWSSLVAKTLHLWTRTVNTALERGCVA